MKGGILQTVHPANLIKQTGGKCFRQIDGVGLKHIQNDFIGLIIAFAVGNTTDDIGQVFVVRQQFCSFITCGARGKTIHGTASGLAVSRRVGMNADKEARAGLSGHVQTLAERYIIISVAG